MSLIVEMFSIGNEIFVLFLITLK